jgi:hypothetical protein
MTKQNQMFKILNFAQILNEDKRTAVVVSDFYASLHEDLKLKHISNEVYFFGIM